MSIYFSKYMYFGGVAMLRGTIQLQWVMNLKTLAGESHGLPPGSENFDQTLLEIMVQFIVTVSDYNSSRFI